MNVDTPSFLSGFAIAFLITVAFKNLIPRFMRSIETRRLLDRIHELEDRLERKDELIKKAIKSSGGKS